MHAIRVLFVLNTLHLVFSVDAVCPWGYCVLQIDTSNSSRPGMMAGHAPRQRCKLCRHIYRPVCILTFDTWGFPDCSSVLSITSILISRFLLELQEADRKIVRLDVNDPLYSSRGWFDSTPSFISSIGAFIDPHLQTSHDADPELRGSSGSYSDRGEDDEERGGWQATEAVPAGSSSST